MQGVQGSAVGQAVRSAGGARTPGEPDSREVGNVVLAWSVTVRTAVWSGQDSAVRSPDWMPAPRGARQIGPYGTGTCPRLAGAAELEDAAGCRRGRDAAGRVVAAVAGLVVAGLVVAGLVVAGLVVAGLVALRGMRLAVAGLRPAAVPVMPGPERPPVLVNAPPARLARPVSRAAPTSRASVLSTPRAAAADLPIRPRRRRVRGTRTLP